MKKYFQSLLLLAVAVATATVFASCGDDETPTPNPRPNHDEEVKMGKYIFDYPFITTLSWPDTERGIKEEYDLYIQGLTSALSAVGVENEKECKWENILANKEKVQCVFDSCGNFEYKVHLCRSLSVTSKDISLTAEAYGFEPIDFGYKTVTSILDLPEGTTCQLYISVSSTEGAAPAVKEYSDQVLALYQDALKDVFTTEYHTETEVFVVRHLNYFDYSGDPAELCQTVQRLCKGVKIPEASQELKDAVKAAKMDLIVEVSVTAYDPQAENPKFSSNILFDNRILAN